MGRIKSEARTTNDPYPRAPDKVETFTILPPAADATRLVPQPAADEHPVLASKSMFVGVPVRRPTPERPTRGSESESESEADSDTPLAVDATTLKRKNPNGAADKTLKSSQSCKRARTVKKL